MARPITLKTFDRVSAAVRQSNALDNPGPPVYGVLGKQRFRIGSITRQSSGRHTVRVEKRDRARFMNKLTPEQARQLPEWNEHDWELYDGFSVPFAWFDYFVISTKGEKRDV